MNSPNVNGNPLLGHLSSMVPEKREIRIPDEYWHSDFSMTDPCQQPFTTSVTSFVDNANRRAEGAFGASITFIGRAPRQASEGVFTRSVEVSGHFVNNFWYAGYGFFYPGKLPVFSVARDPHALLEYSDPVQSDALTEYRTGINKKLLLKPGFHAGEHCGMFFVTGVKDFDSMLLVFTKDFNPAQNPSCYPQIKKPLTERELLTLCGKRPKADDPVDVTFYFVKPEFRGAHKKVDTLLESLVQPGEIQLKMRRISKKEFVRENIQLSIDAEVDPAERAFIKAAFDEVVPDWDNVLDETIEYLVQIFDRAPEAKIQKRYADVESLECQIQIPIVAHHQGREVVIEGKVSEDTIVLGPSEKLFIDGQSPNLGLALEMASPLVREEKIFIHHLVGTIPNMVTSIRSVIPSKVDGQRGRNRKGRFWRERVRLKNSSLNCIWFLPDDAAPHGIHSFCRCVNNHILAEAIVGHLNPVGIGVVHYLPTRKWEYDSIRGDYLDSHTYRSGMNGKEEVIIPMIEPQLPSEVGADCLIPIGVLSSLTEPRVMFNIHDHIVNDARLEVTITTTEGVFNENISDNFRVRNSKSNNPKTLLLEWDRPLMDEKTPDASPRASRPDPNSKPSSPMDVLAKALDENPAPQGVRLQDKKNKVSPNFTESKLPPKHPVTKEKEYQILQGGRVFRAVNRDGLVVLLDEVELKATSSNSGKPPDKPPSNVTAMTRATSRSRERKPKNKGQAQSPTLNEFVNNSPLEWSSLLQVMNPEDVLYYYSRVLDYKYNRSCGKIISRMKDHFVEGVSTPPVPPGEFSFYRPPDGSGGVPPDPLGKPLTGSNY